MQRRGHRLEVDNPTQWQRRNQRWLAEHPWVTTLVGAAAFTGLGLLVAETANFSQLLGLLFGAVFGGTCGWAFSVDNHETSPRGLRKFLYGLAVFAGIAAVIAFRAMT
jgi:hypothetical protein